MATTLGYGVVHEYVFGPHAGKQYLLIKGGYVRSIDDPILSELLYSTKGAAKRVATTYLKHWELNSEDIYYPVEVTTDGIRLVC